MVKVTVLKSSIAVGLSVGDDTSLSIDPVAPPVAAGFSVGTEIGATVGSIGWITVGGAGEKGVAGAVTDVHPVASMPIKSTIAQTA
jgi:hypothetical protein